MKNAKSTLKAKTNTKSITLVLIFTVLIYLALGFVMSIMVLDLGETQIFDLRVQGYNYQEAQEIVDAFGEGSRQLHLFYMVPLDILFPLLYGLLFSMILIQLEKKLSQRISFSPLIFIFPWIPVIFDLLENVLGIIMIHGRLISGIVMIASLATRIKWYSLGGLVILVIILWVLSLFSKKRPSVQ